MGGRWQLGLLNLIDRDRKLPASWNLNSSCLRWLDSAFRIPGLGVRFGLDALVGLIPGVGDTLTSLASLYILNAGQRDGVPRVTLVRMALNIAIDYLLGAVPLVGDVFDVYWKANLRNVALLRKHALATPVEERKARSADRWFVGALIFGLLVLLVASIVAASYLVLAVAQLVLHAKAQ